MTQALTEFRHITRFFSCSSGMGRIIWLSWSDSAYMEIDIVHEENILLQIQVNPWFLQLEEHLICIGDLFICVLKNIMSRMGIEMLLEILPDLKLH